MLADEFRKKADKVNDSKADIIAEHYKDLIIKQCEEAADNGNYRVRLAWDKYSELYDMSETVGRLVEKKVRKLVEELGLKMEYEETDSFGSSYYFVSF